MFRFYLVALIALRVIGLAAPAAAHQNLSMTQADIQWLQDNAFLTGTDVSEPHRRDAARVEEL